MIFASKGIVSRNVIENNHIMNINFAATIAKLMHLDIPIF
jgi:hypothetical protein